jgi:hypothetical protein
MSHGIDEFISVDGRLSKLAAKSKVRGLRVIMPSATTLLPDEYRADDLFPC